jgi:adenosylcobinamide amidohydrolase
MVSFAHPCQVISWAPLHGGLRDGVSHVIIHSLLNDRASTQVSTLLRQVAGRLGLRGTVVGMPTNGDVHSHVVCQQQEVGICLWSVAVRCSRLSVERGLSGSSGTARLDSTTLLLVSDKRLSHEFMLEALASCAEIRAVQQLTYLSKGNSAVGFMAIAANQSPHARFHGDPSSLRSLARETLLQALKEP